MERQISEVKGTASGNLESLEEQILAHNAEPIEIPNKEEHLINLRKYAFFQLHIHLKRGVDLTVRDMRGSSDPYVKFKVGSKTAFKSKIVTKDLNPVWDESFTLSIGDVFKPILIKVYDYNRVIQDDFMGLANLDLTNLEPNKLTKMGVILHDPGRSSNLGKLLLSVTLEPKTYEEKEDFIQRGVTPLEAEPEVVEQQVINSIVTIILIEGEDLRPMDNCGSSDPYAKFRLGTEVHKSRSKIKTLSPRWLDQFQLHLQNTQSHDLEITLWDKNVVRKDDFMGRCKVDLSKLDHEKTHRLWLNVEEGTGRIFVLITISGKAGDDTIGDLINYTEDPIANEVTAKRYGWTRTLRDMKDVGYLQVKVYRAQGLAAEDYCGTSNPFCVLELVNSRLQTQTIFKDLSPNWNKILNFNVKDIHSRLEVSVYDDDRNQKHDFLGKIVIPLLRIKNGERKWYVLKDKSLRLQAKGNFPEILLECSVQWNLVRAAARSVVPKEDKFMKEEKRFRSAKFNRNIARLKPYIKDILNLCKFVISVWKWESHSRSFMTYIIALLTIYFFEIYMLPLALVLLFLKNSWALFITKPCSIDEYLELYTEEPQGEDENEGKRSTFEWIRVINEYIQIDELMLMVQEFCGHLASVLESLKNTLHFCVPFMTWMLIGLLWVVTMVLYLIPVRYLIMMLGLFSFVMKLVRPHPVQHVASTKAKNAVLGFITRVPDDEDLLDFRELRHGSDYHHPTEAVEDVTHESNWRKKSK